MTGICDIFRGAFAAATLKPRALQPRALRKPGGHRGWSAGTRGACRTGRLSTVRGEPRRGGATGSTSRSCRPRWPTRPHNDHPQHFRCRLVGVAMIPRPDDSPAHIFPATCPAVYEGKRIARVLGISPKPLHRTKLRRSPKTGVDFIGGLREGLRGKADQRSNRKVYGSSGGGTLELSAFWARSCDEPL